MLATLRLLRLGVIAVLVLLLSLGAFMALKFWPIGADVPLLKTPEWEDKHIGELNSGRLLLRRETEAGGALLLKRVDLETVYRYDTSARTLDGVTDKEWLNARGLITRCSDQHAKPDRVRIRIDRDHHKLLVGEREVPTAGSVPLSSLSSPSGSWLAVLSATGPTVPPFTLLNGERVLGQRYHQVVSLPDAVSTGNATRIPVMNTVTTLELCWSADERFVVYNDGSFASLVIVETNLNPRNQ